MAQLIDKDAVMAEIKGMRDKVIPNNNWRLGYFKACESILSFLDTLEVKSERAGTEDILNELACHIKNVEIVNVRQVLEWINEQTKE